MVWILTPNQSANSCNVSPRMSLTLASRSLDRSFQRFLISTLGPRSTTTAHLIDLINEQIDTLADGFVHIDVIELKTPAHLSGEVSQLSKFEIAGVAELAGLAMFHCPAGLAPEGPDGHSK